MDKRLVQTKLKRIGDLLIPHVQNIHSPIAIGVFYANWHKCSKLIEDNIGV